ncbi:hypothetical protein QP415_03565 [Pauljensenia sp. UMB3104]|uniref:hypothetical protein n=1 Tax=Pauljensenia sp. UMB3104 TaxID=3046331 RepID=UPI00255174F5|nr:hypothetical protein [Pauljensenia sp. UMB3104]MDK7158938.1 hypothetical protein [Pauljensenia sp. UMB3104]
MKMNDLLLGLHTDPFLTTVVVGLIWPMVQAALDRPYWTPARRKVLLAVVAVVVSLAVWVAGTYPATWRLIIAQASVFLGVAWSVFQVLSAIRINGVTIIDWVGAVTPGGESVEEVRAAADSATSTRVVDGAELDSRD